MDPLQPDQSCLYAGLAALCKSGPTTDLDGYEPGSLVTSRITFHGKEWSSPPCPAIVTAGDVGIVVGLITPSHPASRYRDGVTRVVCKFPQHFAKCMTIGEEIQPAHPELGGNFLHRAARGGTGWGVQAALSSGAALATIAMHRDEGGNAAEKETGQENKIGKDKRERSSRGSSSEQNAASGRKQSAIEIMLATARDNTGDTPLDIAAKHGCAPAAAALLSAIQNAAVEHGRTSPHDAAFAACWATASQESEKVVPAPEQLGVGSTGVVSGGPPLFQAIFGGRANNETAKVMLRAMGFGKEPEDGACGTRSGDGSTNDDGGAEEARMQDAAERLADCLLCLDAHGRSSPYQSTSATKFVPISKRPGGSSQVVKAKDETAMLLAAYRNGQDQHRGMYESTMESVRKDASYSQFQSLLSALEARVAARKRAESEHAKPGQSSENVRVIYADAQKISNRYTECLSMVAEKAGCQWALAPRKAAYRSFEKIALDPASEWNGSVLTDIVRGAVEMQDFAKGLSFLQLLVAADPRDTDVRASFNTPMNPPTVNP
eukprot:gene11388-16927_t